MSRILHLQMPNIDGLMQERSNSIANALELRLSFINTSICSLHSMYYQDNNQNPILEPFQPAKFVLKLRKLAEWWDCLWGLE